MTTVMLVGLIVVLLAAAAYVGLLLLRRTRSAPGASESGGEPPRTVADLVRRRTDPADDLSGPELFVPAVPRQDGVAVPDAPEVAEAAPPAAAPQPATPAGGIEVGDAPWRRAARMTGAEPGGAWETAPLPVVAEPAANEPSAEARQVAAPVAPEVRTDEMPVPAPKVGAPTGSSPSVVIVSRAAAPVPPVTPAAPWTEPEPARPQQTSRLSLRSRHCRRGPIRPTTRRPPDPCVPRTATPSRPTPTQRRNRPSRSPGR